MKLDIIKEIDIFGPRIELRLGKKKSHKTFCGATMTIFVILCCITAFIIIGREVIQKDNPNVKFRQILSDELNELNDSEIKEFGSFQQMNLQVLSFAIGIKDEKGEDLEQSLRDKIQIQINYVEKNGIRQNKIKIPTTQCTSEQVVPSPSDFKDPSAYYCIDGDQLFNLWGEFNDNRANYIEIKLFCDVNDCTEVFKYHSTLRINLSFKDQYFTPDNYEQPFTDLFRDKFINVGLTQNGIESNNNYDFNIQKMTVITDKGWIQAANVNSNYFSFKDLVKSTSVYEENSIIINMNISAYRTIYERSYMKLQDLLAIVGGLMKTLLVVGRILVKPISKLSLNTELVNELFVFEEQRNRRMRKSFVQLSSINSNNFDFEKMERNYTRSKDEHNQLQQINTQYNQHYNNENSSPQPKTPYQFGLKDRNNFIKKLPQSDDSITLFSDPNLIYQKNAKEDEITHNKFQGNQIIISNQSLFKQEAIQQHLQRQKQNTKNINSQSEQSKENLSKHKSNLSNNNSNSSKNNSNLSQNKISNNENKISNQNKQYKQTNKIQKQNRIKIEETSQEQYHTSDISSNQRNKNYIEDNTQISSSKIKTQKQSNFIQKNLNTQMDTCQTQSKSILHLSEKQEDMIIEHNQEENQNQIKTNIMIKQELIKKDCQNSPNETVQLDSDEEDEQKNGEYIQQEQIKDVESQERNSSNTRNRKQLSQDLDDNQTENIPQFNYQQYKKKDTPGFGLKESPQNLQGQKLKDEINQNQNFMSVVKNMPKYSFGRQGTRLITNFLQQNYQVHRGKRKATIKEKSEANEIFSNVLEQVQDKPLHFTWFDYIKYYFGKLKCISKKKQIKFSVKKITERLDIVYILQKLVEIDKLKVLLLTYEQQKLFEYMPKPVVCSDPETQEMQWNKNKADLLKTWTILNSENGNLDKFTEAYHAYKQIYKKSEKEPLDERLIQMLDPDVKKYFDSAQVDASQLSTPYKQPPALDYIKRQQFKRSSSFKPTKVSTQEIQQNQPKSNINQENYKIHRSLSFNEGIQNQLQIKPIYPSSCTVLKMQRDVSDEQRKCNHLSQNNDQNKIQFDSNTGKKIDQNKLTKNEQNNSEDSDQYQNNKNNLCLNDMQLYKKMSFEQNYNVGDDNEGQISYPRSSIHINNKESINQNRQLNCNIDQDNSDGIQRKLNFDNKFSFCRKSLESPNFYFDQNRQSHQNCKNLEGKLNLITQLPCNEVILNDNCRSQMLNQNSQPQLIQSPNRSLSPMQQNRVSSNKKSQFQKKKSLSHHKIENMDENQQVDGEDTFISEVNLKNQQQRSHIKYPNNTEKNGSQRSLSSRRKDSINNNDLQQQNNFIVEIDNRCQQLKNAQNVNLQYANVSTNIQDSSKLYLDPNKINESLRNKYVNTAASFSSIQTIPEENLKLKVDDVKFQNIHQNKFEDEQEFKQKNVQTNLREPGFNRNIDNIQSTQQRKTISLQYPQNEMIHIDEGTQFQLIPLINSNTKINIINNLQPNDSIQNSKQEQFIFNDYGLGSQTFFNNHSINNNKNVQYIHSNKESSKEQQLQLIQQEQNESGHTKQKFEIGINRSSELDNINTNINHKITNYQNQNNQNNIYQSLPINYNEESQVQNSKKQSLKSQQLYKQKSSFYNNLQSPKQINQTDNNLFAEYGSTVSIENQMRQPHNHKQISNNFNFPSSSNIIQIPQQLKKVNSNKSNNQTLSNSNKKLNLNLELNVGSGVLDYGKSPQVQNFLKLNSNSNNQFESPYTRQQKFLKKKQQEKQIQQLNKDSYSQGQKMYLNQSTLSVQNTNQNNYQNKQGNIFNFENIRILENSSFNSFDKLENKSIATPNQRNIQKNQNYPTRERVDTKFSNNDNLLIITEADEQKEFITQEKKESNIEQLIKEKKISNTPQTNDKQFETSDSTINNSKMKQQKNMNTLYHLETNPIEQIPIQTIASESDVILDRNNKTKIDKYEIKEYQYQKYQTKTSTESIILFNDDISETNSYQEN